MTSALIEKTAPFLQRVCACAHMCPPCLYLPSPLISKLMPLGLKRLCTELCLQRGLGLSAASPEGFCPLQELKLLIFQDLRRLLSLFLQLKSCCVM